MADGFAEFPIFLISFVAGAAVVVSLFISKLVRRVSISRVSNTDAHEQTKIAESLSNVSQKSSHQSHVNKSNKKKHGDKHGRDGKQSFNHQWLLTSLKGHSSNILDMEFSPNGKYLATCGEDNAVVIWRTKEWDSNKHKNLKIKLGQDHATLIRWSPESKTFIVKKFLDNVVEIYKFNKKTDVWIKNAAKALTYPKYHDDEIVGLGTASSEKYVVTCSKKTDLVVCDIKGALLARLDTYSMSTSCLCLSPCGRSACVPVNLSREEPRLLSAGKYLQEEKVFRLALSPHVAVASGATLNLFFADTAELDAAIRNIFSGSITCVLFDSEGKFILVSGHKHARIFHNVTGYRATARAALQKLKRPNNSSAMKERLQQQIADAEALVSTLCC